MANTASASTANELARSKPAEAYVFTHRGCPVLPSRRARNPSSPAIAGKTTWPRWASPLYVPATYRSPSTRTMSRMVAEVPAR
jgi:hypothetical protein